MAAAEAEAAAAFVRGGYFEARILEGLRRAVIEAQSPWLDRAGAAAHARCSTSEVDRAANAGVFKRYQRNGTPLFKKSDLDRAIEEGKWRKQK
jgi:hypothetical protein